MGKIINWFKDLFKEERKSSQDMIIEAVEGLQTTLDALEEGYKVADLEIAEALEAKRKATEAFRAKEATLTSKVTSLTDCQASAKRVKGNLHKILNEDL